ncbi:stage V sporulation protein B [Lederbergia galactosidilyticus]|uniref:stage V sporulation protein B n=1 Tax=Lederbergia galactosidilytica TaxID=217031 RepID=UPI001AE6DFCE|nr:stage V sporulation protein B [Lederbergia galactosidilytica]MBP1914896.1 stage V sporulation protein B [Lederbergia galactosidilytica]
MNKFLKGTIILMAAGLITKLLGFINRIVIARMIGAEGVGLFMMSYPTLILVITITQMGLPVAISKAVAEAEAKGDRKKTKKVLAVSLTVTGTLSLIFTPTLMLISPFLSETLFTDPRTFYPLLAITPIIPIVAVSSVIRGYFQGKQNMKPSAVAQVLEQVVRISLIAFLAKKFLPMGIEYAAAAAMAASVIGELASFLYLFTMFKAKKKFRVRKKFFQSVTEGKKTLGELMNVALPTTGGRLIGSVTWFLEPIVVSHSLLLAGIAAGVATKQYGLLTGYALPLLTLPSFFTHSLSTSLVPAISEANANRNQLMVEHRFQQALRFVLMAGCLSTVILYVFAEPLMEWFYGTSDGYEFIQFLAPFFLFTYFQGPFGAILQALNLASAAMINSLIGSVLKILVIFVFASQPAFGINGVALGMAAGTVLVTLLHFATVLKKIQFTVYLGMYTKFILATLLSGISGFLYHRYVLEHHPTLLFLAIGVLLISCIYLIFITGFKLLTKSDLIRLPLFNRILR